VVARRVRKDKRWDAGVGAGGGKPGSNVRVWRSLDVDQRADVKPAERGQHDTNSEKDVATGGAARSGGGMLMRISRRRKTRYGGFE
jgi:hypothetical protein